MPELAKKVLARLRQEQEGDQGVTPSPPSSVDEVGDLPPESASSVDRPEQEPPPKPLALPATTDAECLASLDAEEALFRVWWRTLPDQNLARRRWRSTLSWYHQEKGFGPEMLEALEQRVQDLWETS